MKNLNRSFQKNLEVVYALKKNWGKAKGLEVKGKALEELGRKIGYGGKTFQWEIKQSKYFIG